MKMEKKKEEKQKEDEEKEEQKKGEQKQRVEKAAKENQPGAAAVLWVVSASLALPPLPCVVNALANSLSFCLACLLW